MQQCTQSIVFNGIHSFISVVHPPQLPTLNCCINSQYTIFNTNPSAWTFWRAGWSSRAVGGVPAFTLSKTERSDSHPSGSSTRWFMTLRTERLHMEGISFRRAVWRLPLNSFLHTEVLSLPAIVSFFLMTVKGRLGEQGKQAPLHHRSHRTEYN